MKLFLFLLPSLLCAQISYVAQKTTTLSGAAEVVTIQQPSTGAKLVELKSAYVDCSVACTVTLERNGNPATTTEFTPIAINPGEGTAVSKAFYSSNVGSGTIINVVSIPAGCAMVFDLTKMSLAARNNQGLNFTLRTSSISGVVNITISYTEK